MNREFGKNLRRSKVAAGAAAFAILIFSAADAQASQSRIYSPTLSLTGTCITESLDPVPDPWCPGPPAPSLPFEYPNITIDSFGDMYVASSAKGFGSNSGQNGRIYVFSPQGPFITQISVPGPKALAVDAEGNLYVHEFVSSVANGVDQIVHFAPKLYKPLEGKIEYEDPASVVVEENSEEFGFLSPLAGLAVDPTTGRLFVVNGARLGEWGPANEGNHLLDPDIDGSTLSTESKNVAVDAAHDRILVSDTKPGSDGSFIQAFELQGTHSFLGIINGSDTPTGKFLTDVGSLTIDVDEATGHIFVSDIPGSGKVYEFGSGLGPDEEYLATYEHGFKEVFIGEVAVDNSLTSPNRGTLYVPSSGTIDHTYAFKFVEENAPIVEGVSTSGMTATEAVLHGTI